MYKMILH